MASTAKRNEIFFHIVSQMTSPLQMMYLKVFGTSASLTSPTIALKHLLAKSPVRIPRQATPGLFGDTTIHDAFGIRNKNSRRCEVGSSR